MEKNDLKWGDRIAIMILLRLASMFADHYVISNTITKFQEELENESDE